MPGLSSPSPQAELRLPERRRGPLRQLEARLAFALLLLLVVTLVAFLGREGYRDTNDDGVSLLDAFYYATVSVSTTGYGDITPVTDAARLLNAIVVTPARVLFLILLVGTTLEVLAEGSRNAFRERVWRRSVHHHTIVCGYGTKGRRAIEILIGHETPPNHVVVVDTDGGLVSEAVSAGHVGIHGDAMRPATLERAGVKDAAAVIVAANRDDATVLITLTVRSLNPDVRIIAAVREDENRHALKQSGADEVITSSSAAGRMLGFAATKPRLAEVLEDLLDLGSGLDLVEREIAADDVGKSLKDASHPGPVFGVLRGERMLRFDDRGCQALEPGDKLLALRSNPEPTE